MDVRRTVSESKDVFHKEFQYVIAPIYRRVTDEILVELNLLSNQKSFEINGIFALGLKKAFQELTEGYQPQSHLKKLYEALCVSAGFNPNQIDSEAETVSNRIRSIESGDLEVYLKTLKIGKNDSLDNTQGEAKVANYNKISAIGLLSIAEMIIGADAKKEVLLKQALEFSEYLGYPKGRVEKDIAIYKNNIEKLIKGIELIQQRMKEEERKKTK